MLGFSTRVKVLAGLLILTLCTGFLVGRHWNGIKTCWLRTRRRRKLAAEFDKLKREVGRLEGRLRDLEE